MKEKMRGTYVECKKFVTLSQEA